MLSVHINRLGSLVYITVTSYVVSSEYKGAFDTKQVLTC